MSLPPRTTSLGMDHRRYEPSALGEWPKAGIHRAARERHSDKFERSGVALTFSNSQRARSRWRETVALDCECPPTRSIDAPRLWPFNHDGMNECSRSKAGFLAVDSQESSPGHGHHALR